MGSDRHMEARMVAEEEYWPLRNEVNALIWALPSCAIGTCKSPATVTCDGHILGTMNKVGGQLVSLHHYCDLHATGYECVELPWAQPLRTLNRRRQKWEERT